MSAVLTPLSSRLFNGHRFGSSTKPEHSADCFANLPHGVLAMLCKIERPGRGVCYSQQVKPNDVVDVDIGPDIVTRAIVLGNPMLLCNSNQPWDLHAMTLHPVAKSINQTWADNNRA